MMAVKDVLGLIKQRSDLPLDCEEEQLLYLANLIKERVRSLNDFEEGIRFIYLEPQSYEDSGVKKFFLKDDSYSLLQGLNDILEAETDYSMDVLEEIVRNYAEKCGVPAAKIIHPLRLALTGKTRSPGIFDVMYVLGKNKVLKRIARALSYIESIN